ncbi:hypothetical protein GCM10007276_31250 [Agaricicola taiwanensis]|uniref:Tripartite tricarboxylate transporter substrate binding protein n=1 Tax=Agaricicola taiwanensis TaxID=591372 RepID=A0A8J2YLZ1_9RHOB|nr:tripartite tricarboxylate transporter substrate-binding protein [Agaricicola taiwanensis]GGE51926.1 hypothetical protein GCM10007276_31250 [Agaricicola taiwanensis]
MNIVRRALGAIAFIAVSFAAHAETYPSKQVTIVVPFAPGASNDIFARYLADGLEKIWKQPVIVENKPGAGTAIGSAHVAKSAPDGHTILFTSGSFLTNSASQKNLPFDAKTDLVPVALFAHGQSVIVVGAHVKASTLPELIAEAKSREMFYGTNGVGSMPHFHGELFNTAAGLKLTPVHYKGGAEAFVDIVGGRTDIYIGTVTTVIGGIKGNQLKPIAVVSGRRSTTLPDVATATEGGITGMEEDQKWGVYVPAGTPAASVEALNKAVNQVMSAPGSAEFLEKFGSEFAPMTPEEFKTAVHTELDMWTKLAAERGIAQ